MPGPYKSCNTNSDNVKLLLGVYASWKLLLFAIAVASPGPGYDTSTRLFLSRPGEHANWLCRLADHIALRLTRWDAFYYVSIAQRRASLYEQGWAFGWGATRLLHHATAFVSLPSSLSPLVAHALVGAVISHLCHLASTLIIYALTLQLLPSHATTESRRSIATITALLFVVSPAGIFLSAPYAEAPFSTINLLGMSACVSVWKPGNGHVSRLCLYIVAGACFGLASTVRGNGVLSGLALVEPFLIAGKAVVFGPERLQPFVHLVAVTLAGLLTVAGNVYPQYLAYVEYCSSLPLRVWCGTIPPSIYTFVQSHYWDVGFLRYWTRSNIPLFLLATPVIVILVYTSVLALMKPRSILAGCLEWPSIEPAKAAHGTDEQSMSHSMACLRRLALPQFALAILAATNFHVQIMNRISSGYPVWYIVMALVVARRPALSSSTAYLVGPKPVEWAVRAMVMYAIVQGGLYASFMPPA